MCSSTSDGLLDIPRVGSELSVCGADGEDSEEAESTGYGSDCTSTSPWRLIWCYERCHKKDQEARKRALTQATYELGAALHCLKKGSKFAAWLGHTRARRAPFVLLTDWREAKPCMQALMDFGRQAAVVIVLCLQPRHFERASTWARGMRASGERVYVEQDMDDVHSFVSRLRAWIPRQSGGTMSPRHSGPDVILSDELLREEPLQVRQAYQKCHKGRTEAYAASAPSSPPGGPPLKASQASAASPGRPQQGQGWPACRWNPPPRPAGPMQQPLPLLRRPVSSPCVFGGDESSDGGVMMQSPSMVPPIQSLMQVCASHGSQLEQLLKQSVPDHYED